MKKIFSFLKRNTLVIAISFSLGGFAGYKVLESLGIAFLLSSIPIPEGSIADKDAFIETLPEGKPLVQKELIPVTNNCLLYTSPSPRDATLSRMPSSA